MLVTAMSRVNQTQMTKLLDLLSEDGVLVRGRVSYVNTNKQNFWKRIALQLNSVDGGVYKNTWKWCKMWADWKNKTKKKADTLLRKKNCNYGQQAVPLTNLELRLLKMIDYPMEDKADFLNMQVVNKTEQSEPTTDEMPNFLTESYDAQPIENPMSSDEEDNTVLGLFAKVKNKFCNVDEMLPDGDNKFEACEGSSDIGDKVKMKGKKFKKKNSSLEEFKIKSTLALEKEKVQQKNEELRLRALELKLKGDELRLKEIEMNKINYLTNIEEEKLKCFRDISSYLKELLDRSGNGNIRFHNEL